MISNVRNRVAIVLAGVALAVLLMADPAWACSCDPRPVPGSFENADFVVSGLVTAISLDPQTRLLRVQLDVRESFKTQAPGVAVEIYTAPYGVSCFGFDLHVGREYVLFASAPGSISVKNPPKVPAGALIVWLCGGTAEIGNLQGNQALQQLRKLVRRK
jgi:hypothetical protein